MAPIRPITSVEDESEREVERQDAKTPRRQEEHAGRLAADLRGFTRMNAIHTEELFLLYESASIRVHPRPNLFSSIPWRPWRLGVHLAKSGAKKGRTSEGSDVRPGGGGNEACHEPRKQGCPPTARIYVMSKYRLFVSVVFTLCANSISRHTPDQESPADRLQVTLSVGTNRASCREQLLHCSHLIDPYAKAVPVRFFLVFSV
jgi:hypothetical protein